jgi:hypothetical protein
LGYGEAEHYGREVWRSKVAHLMVAKKQRKIKRKGEREKRHLLKACSSGLYSPTRSYLLTFLSPPDNAIKL